MSGENRARAKPLCGLLWAATGLLVLVTGLPVAAHAQTCPIGTFLCPDFSGCCDFGTVCGTGFNDCPPTACCVPDPSGGGSGGGGAGGGGEPSEIEVCEDTCGAAFDGVCQDGMGEDARCAYGSDCADCGPRLISRDEVGGCRAGPGVGLWGLLVILGGLLFVRRLRLVALLLFLPGAASAQEGFQLDVAPTVLVGAIANGQLGVAELGPRVRLGLHWAPTESFGLGVQGSLAATGQIGRADDDGEASQLVGGRGLADLGLLGCYLAQGGRDLCFWLGGFAGIGAQHRLRRRGGVARTEQVGPAVAAYVLPHWEQGRLRGVRFELAWDALNERVEARLGFEL